MNASLSPLLFAAVSIGFVHTLFGPDHYVPFVAMARVGKWSLGRTMVVTFLCGIGHVASSAILGLIGVTFGIAVLHFERIEAFRGNVAGWLLLAFGVIYFLWGIRRAIRNRPHAHAHVHADGTVHSHEHTHHSQHLHVHPGAATAEGAGSTMTPWILFTIFLFGPCEPLIPLVMYPAAQGNFLRVILVTCLFGAVTLATMMSVVALMYAGTNVLPLERFNRYTHAAAGLAVTMCGVAVVFFDM